MQNINHKTKYIVGAIIAGLIIIYGLVYFIGKHYLNTQKVRDLVTSRIETRLNRTVTMSDNIGFSVSWDLSPKIHLHDITVSNIKSSSQPIMLSLETLYIKFNLVELLFNKIHVNELQLIKPILHLETNNKINNWDFDKIKQTATPATNTDTGLKVNIDEIYVIDGILTHTENKQASNTLVIKKLDLETADDNSEYDCKLVGQYNKLPLTTKFNATITPEHMQIELNKLKLGNSDLNGKLTVKPKEVVGDLESSHLELKDFSSATSNTGGQYSLPNQQLPLEHFKGAKVDFAIKIKTLNLGNMALYNVGLKVTAKNNVVHMAFNPALNIPGGVINASLDYDLKPNTPTLIATIKSNAIQLEALLNATMKKSPISGSMLEITSNLQSRGSSLQSLVSNMQGRFLATVSSGKYLNSNSALSNIFSNILSAMITFDKRQNFTTLKCAVTNFKINNGVAVANKGIGVEASSVNVTGSGQVDLRSGRINFAINPQTTLTNLNPIDIAQMSIAQLINVTGTISEPKISLDPVNMLTGTGGAILSRAVVTGMTGGIGGLAVLAEAALKPVKQITSAAPCQQALAN